GPFKLVGDFVDGSPIKVERNPNYWGNKPYLDGVVFNAVVDEAARANALKSHDDDVIFTQDSETIRQFRSTAGVKEVEDVAAEEVFAMLNLAAPPFDNMHARRALALATDRNGIVDVVGDGVKQPANGPYTDGEKFYNAESG